MNIIRTILLLTLAIQAVIAQSVLDNYGLSCCAGIYIFAARRANEENEVQTAQSTQNDGYRVVQILQSPRRDDSALRRIAEYDEPLPLYEKSRNPPQYEPVATNPSQTEAFPTQSPVAQHYQAAPQN
ncbi:hypothetical protein HK098_007095 [Nowakowskiella sp. JEL0407]|nr:hypothetical protein HK098_007095 [Nowakowskiella sp. JEL0407]